MMPSITSKSCWSLGREMEGLRTARFKCRYKHAKSLENVARPAARHGIVGIAIETLVKLLYLEDCVVRVKLLKQN
jgi:hypothetical protein